MKSQWHFIKISLTNHCHANICITPAKVAASTFQPSIWTLWEQAAPPSRSLWEWLIQRRAAYSLKYISIIRSDSCVLCANNTPRYSALCFISITPRSGKRECRVVENLFACHAKDESRVYSITSRAHGGQRGKEQRKHAPLSKIIYIPAGVSPPHRMQLKYADERTSHSFTLSRLDATPGM